MANAIEVIAPYLLMFILLMFMALVIWEEIEAHRLIDAKIRRLNERVRVLHQRHRNLSIHQNALDILPALGIVEEVDDEDADTMLRRVIQAHAKEETYGDVA